MAAADAAAASAILVFAVRVSAPGVLRVTAILFLVVFFLVLVSVFILVVATLRYGRWAFAGTRLCLRLRLADILTDDCTGCPADTRPDDRSRLATGRLADRRTGGTTDRTADHGARLTLPFGRDRGARGTANGTADHRAGLAADRLAYSGARRRPDPAAYCRRGIARKTGSEGQQQRSADGRSQYFLRQVRSHVISGFRVERIYRQFPALS